jgi:hypothetical protein
MELSGAKIYGQMFSTISGQSLAPPSLPCCEGLALFFTVSPAPKAAEACTQLRTSAGG